MSIGVQELFVLLIAFGVAGAGGCLGAPAVAPTPSVAFSARD